VWASGLRFGVRVSVFRHLFRTLDEIPNPEPQTLNPKPYTQTAAASATGEEGAGSRRRQSMFRLYTYTCYVYVLCLTEYIIHDYTCDHVYNIYIHIHIHIHIYIYIYIYHIYTIYIYINIFYIYIYIHIIYIPSWQLRAQLAKKEQEAAAAKASLGGLEKDSQVPLLIIFVYVVYLVICVLYRECRIDGQIYNRWTSAMYNRWTVVVIKKKKEQEAADAKASLAGLEKDSQVQLLMIDSGEVRSHVERRCYILGPTQSRISRSILEYTKIIAFCTRKTM